MNFVHLMHESHGLCKVQNKKMDSLLATHLAIIHALAHPLVAHISQIKTTMGYTFFFVTLAPPKFLD